MILDVFLLFWSKHQINSHLLSLIMNQLKCALHAVSFRLPGVFVVTNVLGPYLGSLYLAWGFCC